MPDKVSPSKFAASVKAKYPEYQSYDDIELTNAIIKKFPEYKDYVDFGGPVPAAKARPTVGLPTFQQQVEYMTPLVSQEEVKPSKYQEAVNKDKSEIGKTLSTLYNGIVGSFETLTKFVTETPVSVPITPFQFSPVEMGKLAESASAFRNLPIEERLKIAEEGRKGIEETFDIVRSGYTTRKEEQALKGQFNVMDGIGLKDMQALIGMSGGLATDMALGAATGGATFVAQGVQNSFEDFDAAAEKSGYAIDPAARNLYGLAGGIINGVLEKFAVDKIVGDVPVFRDLQRKVIANVLKNTANVTGKRAVDAIEEAAVAEIRALTNNFKRAGYRALVEGGTEGAQAALEDGAKFAANAVQGNEVFNQDEIAKGFISNVVNSAVAGGIFGPVFGAGADVAFGKNVNTELLKDIAEAKTSEDLDAIRQELTKTFDENNFSEQEREIIMNNANRYAQIKQTIPEGTPALSQAVAIPKIEQRMKLDDEITKKTEYVNTVDEALKASEEQELSFLQDRRASINDEIREIVSNDTFTYTEENGKYYKSLEGGPKEEISKNRYDLEQIKKGNYATQASTEQIEEGRAEGDIDQRQGAEEVQDEEAFKADIGYRYIVGEEGDDIPVTALLNKKVKVKGQPAILYQQGQTVEARIIGTNRIIEIGNVNKLMNELPEVYDIELDEVLVTETPQGYRIEGQPLKNTNENPLDAISLDQNGNVMNVVLTTPAGKRRKFRGQVAQDLAYQIQLKEILKDEEQFEEFLAREHQAELDAAAQLEAQQEPEQVQEPTEEQAAPAIERISPRQVEPTYGRVTDRDATTSVRLPNPNRIQRKVLNDARKVATALEIFIPRTTGQAVQISLHDANSFEEAVLAAGGSQQDATSRGFYMATDGSIHLNMDNIDTDTVLHEGFHPVLDFVEATNPAKINEFYNKLASIPGAEAIIAKAKELYGEGDAHKKEAITDFVAAVADGRIVVNPSNFQKIKAFVLNLVKSLGIGSGQKILTVKDETGLVALSKYITEQFTSEDGLVTANELRDIVDTQVNELASLADGDNQFNSSDGVDIEQPITDASTGRKPQFSKTTLANARNNVKSIRDFIGTKISRIVFYDITRVGPLSIKNIKTGYTPKVEGKGGPMYSYMDNSIKNKSVLAFVSINQAIQSLQRQMMFPDAVHAVASQNPLTAHLGNKSTLSALFGDKIGLFQNAVASKDKNVQAAQEAELLGVLKSEIERIANIKVPDGAKVPESKKAVDKILQSVNLNDIKTLNQFRDNILLGKGDSFGSRGSILSEILQNKKTKVTASTRDSHKIIHYKYGIPTLADIAEGNNQKELSNVELGDVMKLVRPSVEPVIYTTSKEMFDRYSQNPTPEMKKSGIRIELLPEQDAHESYPFVLAGENVALLDEYVGAQQFYDMFKDIKKSGTFFKLGRMKKEAQAGEVPSTITTEKKGPAFQRAAPTKALAKKGIVGITKLAVKEYARYGVLGKEGIILKEKKAGELSAELATAEKYAKDAILLTKKYKNSVSKTDVVDFMTGQPVQGNLPSDLAAALSNAREHVDNLTERLIQLGVIDDQETIDYYRENKGKYLLRSYEAIDYNDNFGISQALYGKGLNIDNVAKKLNNVDKSVVDAALKFLADRAMAQNSSLSEADAMKQARIEANGLLSNAEEYVMQRGLTGSTNISSIGKRLSDEELSPELRALMGEYTDPIYNYYASVFKIASLTSSRQYLNSMKEYGMDKFIFPYKTEEATVQIAGEGSKGLEPLNGMYTFPEIYEALKKAENDKPMLITQIAGRVRKFKTVYNPATHIKNIIGNTGFAISNGHWNYIPEAYKYMRASIVGGDDKDVMRMMDTLNRYGVLNNTLGIGELKQYFKRNENVDDFLTEIYKSGGKNTAMLGKAAGTAKDVVTRQIPKFIEKAYQIEDDLFKILGFVNESNRYAKAKYQKAYDKLNETEKKDIDGIASEIVKDTYPTFTRVPKGVKTLSKALFLGNFLSFPVESVRVQYNALALARKEMLSGNPRLKTVGLSRIAGAVAYNSLLSSMVYYGFSLAGAGLTGMLGVLNGDDDEERENSKAIQRFVAPWNKNTDKYPTSFANGKLSYYDIGSLDSYNYQKRVWNAFWSNLNNKEGFNKAISESMSEALDPWLQRDFVLDNFNKLMTNPNNSIYNPKDEPWKQWQDKSMFVAKQMGPGFVGASIKIADSYTKGDYDKAINEAYSQIVRRYDVDLEKQFRTFIYVDNTNKNSEIGFKDALRNTENIYTRAKDAGAKGIELSDAYREAVDKYKEQIKTIKEYYDSAIRGGVPAKKLNEIMNKSGFSPAVKDGVIKGKFNLPDNSYIKK